MIDVQEWAKRMVKTNRDHFPDTLPLTMEYARAAAQVYVDLMRAVIADHEAAKAAPQPVAEAEVPEWCEVVAKTNLDGVGVYCRPDVVETHSIRIHEAAESEISRRVAEATEAKDKRIAELSNMHDAVYDDRASARMRLTECALKRDSRRQQLAASQAEVARLKEEAVMWDQQSDARHSDIVAGEKEITKLREEVARLSRPVDGVDGDDDWFWANEREALKSEGSSRHMVKAVVRERAMRWLRAERSAREAAEAERDELRAVIIELADRLETDGHTRLHSACWKCDLYHKLAAFRAEKAKVAT